MPHSGNSVTFWQYSGTMN